MTHTANPVPNPVAEGATVCADCGAPLARTNARASASGWKHYATSAGYKAHILELLAPAPARVAPALCWLETRTGHNCVKPTGHTGAHARTYTRAMRNADDARVARISNEIDGLLEDGITPVVEDGWVAEPSLERAEAIASLRISALGVSRALEAAYNSGDDAVLIAEIDEAIERLVERRENVRRTPTYGAPIPEELQGPLLSPAPEPKLEDLPCDECGHAGSLHASAHENPALWASVTCWAELVCATCARG